MADFPQKTRENVDSLQNTEKGPKNNADQNIKIDTGLNYSDVLGEDAESMGHVSEGVKDTDARDLGGTSGGQTSQNPPQFDPAQLRAQLLQKAPPLNIMKKQIESEIKKEINYLHSKAMKMMRNPGEVNYFEMSNLMKKIRELKTILGALLKASVDTLKTLWLRYVHGIM